MSESELYQDVNGNMQWHKSDVNCYSSNKKEENILK